MPCLNELLPDAAVEEMAQAPLWPDLVAVAPTLVYDHKASHDIKTDPKWRSRWAAVTVPSVVYSGDQTFQLTDRAACGSELAELQAYILQRHG
jgi:hypothetical protein